MVAHVLIVEKEKKYYDNSYQREELMMFIEMMIAKLIVAERSGQFKPGKKNRLIHKY